MQVKDVMALAKIRLQHIAVAKDDAMLIRLTNYGVSDLSNRFNLDIKSETVALNPNLALYELQNDNVQMLLTLYDPTGRELQQPSTLNGIDYDFKIVNYRSFMIKNPRHSFVFALYKANPIELKDEDDIIDIPQAMMDALVCYVVYAAQGTINRDNMNESGYCYQRYLEACTQLELQGYRVPLNTEVLSVQSKGFV